MAYLTRLLLALTLLPFLPAHSQRTPLQADLSAQFGPARPQLTWDAAYTAALAASSKLTFSQKVSLTTGTGISLGPCSGNIAKIDRISFPYLCLQDGPVGLRGVDKVSVFPAGVTTASTWDRELMYLRSRAMGVENRIKGVHVALAPVAGGLGRAPQAGRTWEGFGPDPYLAGVGNAESVRGLQDEGVIACAKHWIGNEQERYRFVLENLMSGTTPPILESISSNIPERALKEVYEWPFVEAVEAGVGSIMCAYQEVNGTYSCESTTLLRDHLKGPAPRGLGFRGFVMTDWFASASPGRAADAGVDMVMPGDLGLVGTAAGGMKASDGAVPGGSRLDEMVVRILAAWYKLGQNTTDYPATSFSTWNSADTGVLLDRLFIGTINKHVQATNPLHAALARRIAAEGTVLLKNVNTPTGSGRGLPLPPTLPSLAVFGSDAGPIPGGPNSCGSFSTCAQGTLAVGWGSGAGTFPYLIDPLAALTNKSRALNIPLTAVLNDYDYPLITATARNASTCLVFLKSSSGEGLANVEGNVGDRQNLTAWRDGDTLATTVAASCANTIVVVHAVGPILMDAWIDHPNITAVLLAHLPGQESGNALLDVLWGATNPSGKLPYTIARREADYCCRVQSEYTGLTPQQEFPEGVLLDYRWFDKRGVAPRFPFGFGLSYTSFTYHADTLSISAPRPAGATGWAEPLFEVSLEIENTGAREGMEVVQLYVGFPAGTRAGGEEAVRQLRGFEKVRLAVGERRVVVFAVRKRDVAWWDVGGAGWSVVMGPGAGVGAGGYRVWVGRSSRELEAEGRVVLA